MAAAKKPLRNLTAADLMSREVVAVTQTMPMQEAAQLIARHRISGAPVLDADGRCVGVLSATDFFHGVLAGDLENLPADTVAEHMTADPVMTSPATSAPELARMMLDGDVRRVIVVDAERRPLGVVSSTDLLAALAYTT
jgi:CBS domain-containing membrane protein